LRIKPACLAAAAADDDDDDALQHGTLFILTVVLLLWQELAIERLRVRILVFLVTTLGMLFTHTHMCLSHGGV